MLWYVLSSHPFASHSLANPTFPPAPTLPLPILGPSFLPIQVYLIDTYKYAASALAASTVLRSLFGFAFPLFGDAMYARLGAGGGNSLLAGVRCRTALML